MLTFKTIAFDELKETYAERHGFVFSSDNPSSDEGIESLCNMLIEKNVTTELPEFVIRFSPSAFACVYGVDTPFDGPTFWRGSATPMAMGIAKVDTLYNFIKYHNK